MLGYSIMLDGLGLRISILYKAMYFNTMYVPDPRCFTATRRFKMLLKKMFLDGIHAILTRMALSGIYLSIPEITSSDLKKYNFFKERVNHLVLQKNGPQFT